MSGRASQRLALDGFSQEERAASVVIPHYSSEDGKLEPLTEKRSIERLDLLRSYVMQTQRQQTVHHEGDHFSCSAVKIELGEGEIPLYLMGSLCMDPC